MIPASVTHADLLTALEPLLTLLGTDPMTVYADPPFTIQYHGPHGSTSAGDPKSLGDITFTVAAHEGLVVDADAVQRSTSVGTDDYRENAVEITVRVV